MNTLIRCLFYSKSIKGGPAFATDKGPTFDKNLLAFQMRWLAYLFYCGDLFFSFYSLGYLTSGSPYWHFTHYTSDLF